jgi:hypothetical protein
MQDECRRVSTAEPGSGDPDDDRQMLQASTRRSESHDACRLGIAQWNYRLTDRAEARCRLILVVRNSSGANARKVSLRSPGRDISRCLDRDRQRRGQDRRQKARELRQPECRLVAPGERPRAAARILVRKQMDPGCREQKPRFYLQLVPNILCEPVSEPAAAPAPDQPRPSPAKIGQKLGCARRCCLEGEHQSHVLRLRRDDHWNAPAHDRGRNVHGDQRRCAEPAPLRISSLFNLGSPVDCPVSHSHSRSFCSAGYTGPNVNSAIFASRRID